MVVLEARCRENILYSHVPNQSFSCKITIESISQYPTFYLSALKFHIYHLFLVEKHFTIRNLCRNVNIYIQTAFQNIVNLQSVCRNIIYTLHVWVWSFLTSMKIQERNVMLTYYRTFSIINIITIHNKHNK